MHCSSFDRFYRRKSWGFEFFTWIVSPIQAFICLIRHYGGWVCPNIYFLGYSNVLDFAGLKIAGISGIFDKKKKSSLNSSHQHSRISRNDIKFSYYYREPEYKKLFSVSLVYVFSSTRIKLIFFYHTTGLRMSIFMAIKKDC